ncbi:hypothetical protein GCM10017784_08170 [Deinococcus indicus]|nr:hypothetical protein GCM10017784_08170 [Deinococcus indicus]
MIRNYTISSNLVLSIGDNVNVDLVDSILIYLKIENNSKIEIALYTYMGDFRVKFTFEDIRFLELNLDLTEDHALDSIEFAYRGYDSNIYSFSDDSEGDVISLRFLFSDGRSLHVGSRLSIVEVSAQRI